MSEELPNIKWLERMSKLMDAQFKIPGTEIRFGLDPIIGLIPFVGDITTFIISGGLLISMAKHGVSKKVVILMVLNVLFDAIISAIPVVGNIFDFTFRANQRNIRLLKEHYVEGKHHGSGSGIILLIILILLLALGGLIFGLVKLTQFFIDML